MLDTSTAWAEAVTADARRTMIRAIVEIIDPDIVYGSVTSSGGASWSKAGQLTDHDTTVANYASLERNRWILDGSAYIMPDNYNPGGEVGFVSAVLAGDDGSFTPAQYVQMSFSGVSLLQACTINFPDTENDGLPVDLTVEIMQSGTAYHTESITGNTEPEIIVSGFSVPNADGIRVTVTKWSLPGRRMRVCEIVPGVIETWGNDDIISCVVTQEANMAGLAIPFGTCQLTFDNSDRRFNPRNKAGLFESLEERQGIVVALGIEMDGSVVYQPTGTFYQYALGWHTGDYDMSLTWSLVDIIGLLAQRQYIPPSTLPTTVSGWVASIVGQLGTGFGNRYAVDSSIASTALTVRVADDVASINCGQLLQDICMAAGAFCKADAATGKLAVLPAGNSGTEMTLGNLEEYPIMTANDDVAAIIFTLNDGANTQYTVSGTETSSGNTVSVSNPFIKTTAAALAAARHILTTYGGNRIETKGRGNPASEIGDVDSVEITPSDATAGRRIKQSFELVNGVLAGCSSTLLQADGFVLYEQSQKITVSGSWTVPSGVSSVRLVLVGHGADGTDGTDGTWRRAGEDGVNGDGGKVWTGTVSVTAGQSIAVTIGSVNTTFGSYSSANGTIYPTGYTDLNSGDVYGRSGVSAPLAGTGDGGAGGAGGWQGVRERNPEGGWYYNLMPGEGQPGAAGATGCCVIYWDR